MLDIKLIRSNPDAVKAAIARRGESTSAIDEIVELDSRLRALSTSRDELRAEIRQTSKQVGLLHAEGKSADTKELAARSRALGAEEKVLDERCTQLSREIEVRLLNVSNMPSSDAPDGFSEDANVEVRNSGFDPERFDDHQKVPHWDVGEQLQILDVDRAVRLSGSMFVMYRGAGAQLLRALIAFGLERNRDAFEEVRPPTLVKSDTMIGSGHLPKFADDAYHVSRDDLWAIPTAEVPLTSMFAGEVLSETDLPLRLMAHTSCYRREAGAAGRDTRGLLRVHEFDKVEMYAFCTPQQGHDMHHEILDRAEGAIRDLGLTYRILDLACGDISGAGTRTFDIEVFAPGADRWLEVSSVSWCTDYQTRRANIRFRRKGTKGTEFAHSLNGSALAVPRVWAAIVETYRQPDGSVEMPEALHPYLGGLTKIEPRIHSPFVDLGE
ncbi:MAG: serine--tRNA ligase [Acidimicrobiia bacterium]|nr:serine--tRNA ligase [Acidimicrobiia bacterium]MCY4458512.1 serine--tRNA ligase [Acidimicrobiaceae bacterium]